MKNLMQVLADENALLNAKVLQAVKGGGSTPPVLFEDPPQDVPDSDPWWKFW